LPGSLRLHLQVRYLGARRPSPHLEAHGAKILLRPSVGKALQGSFQDVFHRGSPSDALQKPPLHSSREGVEHLGIHDALHRQVQLTLGPHGALGLEASVKGIPLPGHRLGALLQDQLGPLHREGSLEELVAYPGSPVQGGDEVHPRITRHGSFPGLEQPLPRELSLEGVALALEIHGGGTPYGPRSLGEGPQGGPQVHLGQSGLELPSSGAQVHAEPQSGVSPVEEGLDRGGRQDVFLHGKGRFHPRGAEPQEAHPLRSELP